MQIPDRTGFLKSVSEEFYRLDGFQKAETIPIEELRVTAGYSAFILVPFMRWLHGRALKTLAKQREKYPAVEEEANLIVSQQDTQTFICRAFRTIPKDEILTEYAFVKIFSEALYNLAIETHGQIRFDPVLFAVVAHKITITGIREYCHSAPK
ncbi:MAG: hypothetical protein ACRD6X_17105 [Pyrinomonadaceae bacterium]